MNKFERLFAAIVILLSVAAVPTAAAQEDSEYVYEYKYGPGQYNYDVEGFDEDGNYLSGNVDTNDRYVDGYIYDDEGNETYFSGEWVDYGVIEGYDEDGDWVQLEVE